MKIKEICFIGNFEVDYSSENHYLKTLQKLGYTVYTIQENKTTSSEILDCLNKPNVGMLFWVHTHGWNIDGIEHVFQACKDFKIPTVGYHLDLWNGIERVRDLETDPYWEIDYFFTVDKVFVQDLVKKGIKAYFLPAGVFEDECYKGKAREEYKYDIIFVGSRNYHPEWPYRKQLIEWLEATYGDRFAQFGGGGKGTIRGKDLNDLYASAKIVVGDTLCKDFVYPFYLSDRIFETTGRGGFLIHPYIAGVGKLFKMGKEVVFYPFNNFKYLKYCIDYYLQNEEEREKIRKAGMRRTKKDHTYTKRLQFILETIENETNSN